MPRTLFISDLHLWDSRPQITQLFLDFLGNTAKGADALYILGDLFEYWAGDDVLLADRHHQRITMALQVLVRSGTPVFVMNGNRDLLLGRQFEAASGAQLIPDPTVVERYGRTLLLTHGDALCTDDVEYQAFRRQVQAPAWQQEFLAQPLALRKAQIEGLRQQSEQEKSRKNLAIMDVNADAVNAFVRQHAFPQLVIHGHTHRMGRHQLTVDGHGCERIVLGDWYESGSYLEYTAAGCKFAKV